MSAPAPTPAPLQGGPVPVIVGAVGHRDLRTQDREPLEKIVREFLASVQSRYPNTPLLIATSLAEGAECLVARVGLALGARLIVPLPFLQGVFESEFRTPAGKEEFHNLIRRSEQRFSMPMLEGVTPDSIREAGPQRDKQYALCGAWIVQNCHYLIALWDGVDRKLVGQIAQIVQFQLNGVPEPYGPASTPFDPPETGPVMHVMTPRSTKPGPADQAPSEAWLYPKGIADDSRIRSVLGRIDAFNRQARAGVHPPSTLIPDTAARGLPDSARQILNQHAVATAAVAALDARARSAITRLLALFDHRDVPLRRSAAEARALAEALRVQFFWKLGGLDDSAAQYFLRRRPGDLDWIRGALRAANLPVTGEKGVTVRDGVDLVVEHWFRKMTGPGANPVFARATPLVEHYLARQDLNNSRRVIRDVGREALTEIEYRLVVERGA